jgi:hypothetical protein
MPKKNRWAERTSSTNVVIKLKFYETVILIADETFPKTRKIQNIQVSHVLIMITIKLAKKQKKRLSVSSESILLQTISAISESLEQNLKEQNRRTCWCHFVSD